LQQAEEKIQAEQLDAAEGLLQEAVRHEPANTSALYRLAYVQYRRRELVPARTNFSAVVRLAPPAYNSRYFLGRISLLEDRAKEAIQWLEPVVTSGDSSFDAASQLAKAYASAGELRKAVGPLLTAINQAPWDGSLYYRLGQLYQKTGEQELARNAFETSTRLKSATAQDVEIMLRTSQLLGSGKTAEAIELSARILQRPLVEPGSLVALGVVFGNANLPSEALKSFERAAAADGSLFEAQFNYGLALLKLNRPADALVPLKRAFELLPQSEEAATTLGLAAVMNQRYADAIPPLELASKRDPANTRQGALLATVYLRSGAPAKAVPILRGLARRANDDATTRLLLIEALDASGDREKALEEALRLEKQFPGVAHVHMAAAQQLVQAGKYEQAGAAFEEVLRLAPGQKQAELGLADCLQKSGRYQSALDHYRAAGLTLPARLGAARSLIALQQLDEARRVLESSLSDYPSDVALRLELSRVYARLGQTDLAAEQAKIIERLRAQ
jgi:tetratricopeptide (TPR) repeat protein